MKKINLNWKVATKQLFDEICSNPQCSQIMMPLRILYDILREVAKRSNELKDPELNKLMLRLGLYSIADPESPDYDLKLVEKILSA